jgi:hypothetical protein
MTRKFLPTIAVLGAMVLLTGCFESKPTAPPTKAEFHLACVRLLVQGHADKSTSVSPAYIVSVCNCLAEQIQKSEDPEFRLRVQRAFVDADGDVKTADANAKAYLKSLAADSAEYLIEKSKQDELERRAKFCNKN